MVVFPDVCENAGEEFTDTIAAAVVNAIGIATVAVFSFLRHWNAFLIPLIYLNSMVKFTFAIGLRFFQLDVETGGDPRDHLLMVVSLMVAIPDIVLFFTMRRYFVRGVVTSGIKG